MIDPVRRARILVVLALHLRIVATQRDPAMPEIIVYLVEGRTKQAKQALMKDITDAVVRNFGVNPEVVVVQIVESSKENKSKGGIPFSER